MISIKFDKKKHSVPEFHATGNSTKEVKTEVSEAVFHAIKEMAITFDMEVDEVLEELESSLETRLDRHLKEIGKKKKRFNFSFKLFSMEQHEYRR